MPSLESRALADGIREAVIRQSRRANVGHIGSALSIADILAALYSGVMDRTGEDRDRFTLSKGHAALALYAALELTGELPEGTLDSFCAEDTLLGVHPEHELDGVDFCTGSLGQGLSMGVGAALAGRLQGSDRRSYVVMSDAELNEGSVWEAAMLAAHHALDNLVLIIDVNGQQALGYTKDVLDLGRVDARFEAFGWDAQVVDGHDTAALRDAVQACEQRPGRPHVITAMTTFGYGVSFMESRIEWHYLPLDETQFGDALAELARAVDPA